MTRILYSADYELYLGENFLPENEVLIEPTIALLAACERIRVPLTLFADVACIWRYREEGDERSRTPPRPSCATRSGGDTTSRYISTRTGCMRAARTGAGRAARHVPRSGTLDDPAPLLARAKTYLEELLRPIDPEYSCVAFRAGHYGLQPEHQRVFAALVETGYEVDSSVVPGLVLRDEMAQVDYRGWRWPEKGRPIYDIYEVPIARRCSARSTRSCAGSIPPEGARRGRSIRDTSGHEAILLSPGSSASYPLELGPNARRLQKIARRYLRRVGKDVEFAFSSHPKAVTTRARGAGRLPRVARPQLRPRGAQLPGARRASSRRRFGGVAAVRRERRGGTRLARATDGPR